MEALAAASIVISAAALATNAILWLRAMRRIRTWSRGGSVAPPQRWPFVHVFVCMKGELPRIAESVRALEHQDYPGDARITFIVERGDPSHAPIQRLVEGSARMDVKVVGRVTESGWRCAQKNHNLLRGIDHAESGDRPPEVYAFCDGDLVVSASWLSEMIRPIAAELSEASTSFHFVESRERAVLGALHGMAETWQSIAAVLCQGATWGGSMAIRRESFQRVGLADVWRETVVDDLTMFRVMKAGRVRVAPVPQFLVSSKSEITSYRAFVRWLGRQFFFVKIYSPFWYAVLGAQMLLNGAALGVVAAHVALRLATGSWPLGAGTAIAAALAAAGVLASFYFSRFLLPEKPPVRAWFGAALLVNGTSLLACADATLRRRKLTWSDFTYVLGRDGRVADVVGGGLVVREADAVEAERAIA
jgi:hypothetical protein